MFKNYFKTALRNLWKNKASSLINILGLGLGLACGLLIILWVNDEYNKDSFHKNAAQLYSVFERRYNDGVIGGGFATQGLMAGEMKKIYPEVQYAVNMGFNTLSTFEANDKILKVNGNFAGPDFFNMFSYPLLGGNPSTALQSPVDIAISKKMAEDFFGSAEDAMGKTMRYENKKELKITAVFENVPSSSSAQFDYLINWNTFLDYNDWAKNWTNNGPPTYIMLRPGTQPKPFEAKIARFLDNYNMEQTENNYIRLGLQRYRDQYLYSGFKNGEVSGGRIVYVQIFSLVALFILLIACINFMNLTTARSLNRAKEIGVRKVVGALRSSLIRQFIGEAILVVAMAVIISLSIVILVLPQFNQLTQKQIMLPVDRPDFWLVMVSLILGTGLISGSYPALYLSGFNPLRVLKGPLKYTTSSLLFRKGLVVFQFVLSIVLIIGTLVIGKQVDYTQSANLGYNRDNLIYIRMEGDLAAKYTAFKNQGLNLPGIKEITRMSQSPTRVNNGTTGIEWEGKNPASEIDISHAAVGYDFIKTMQAELKEERDFSKDFSMDSVGYIVNETALQLIGYKDPIGKPLTQWKKKGTIIGVVIDFHINSLHTAITPLVLRLGENDDHGTALVRTEPGKTKEALASLKSLLKEINPQFPFTYKFSDEEYQKLYSSELLVRQLSNYFAFMAIFISCLGLFGLVISTAQQRTREFGIRKVLGASPGSLFGLLSKEFLILVFFAIIIASPIAWTAMDKWLQNYEYRINLSGWIFVFAGVLAILIALATVSYQALKAAFTNPVKSLRAE